MPVSPDTVFDTAFKEGASDVHVAVGIPLTFRVSGALTPQGKEKSTTEKVDQFIKSVLGATQYKRFLEEKEIDASYSTKKGVRLRVNCHYERGNPGLVARIIPDEIPGIDDVGLDELEYLCEQDQGLILFTGPTGAGKSTSMAAMIQRIASNQNKHIITLEDPIEFVFQGEQGIIRQRQFGSDFSSFPEAMKRVLRQDPDIIMVGEMRDLETISAALTLAETGHLVFATLHTPDAMQTTARIVDVFPAHQQQQIRIQLSLSLIAIIAQRLIPCVEGGRVAQREVLINTSAVSNIIRENRIQELKSVIQTGGETGMCTFKKNAEKLHEDGLIDDEVFEWCKGM